MAFAKPNTVGFSLGNTLASSGEKYTKYPVTPSTIVSIGPPLRIATTGTPASIASRGTIPKCSRWGV
ncbi:hypothetical protein ACHAXH_006793 [Discostella pseudostelligera]